MKRANRDHLTALKLDLPGGRNLTLIGIPPFLTRRQVSFLEQLEPTGLRHTQTPRDMIPEASRGDFDALQNFFVDHSQSTRGVQLTKASDVQVLKGTRTAVFESRYSTSLLEANLPRLVAAVEATNMLRREGIRVRSVGRLLSCLLLTQFTMFRHLLRGTPQRVQLRRRRELARLALSDSEIQTLVVPHSTFTGLADALSGVGTTTKSLRVIA